MGFRRHWETALTGAAAALVSVLLASAVAGQDQSTAENDGTVAAAAATYRGVVPGSGQSAPNAPRVGERLVLTWPGFQPRPDGASRFFVQTNGPVRTSTSQEGDRFVITLHDTQIRLTNNARTLITRFFNTPVDEALIERRRRDVTIVLKMRRSVTPTVTSEAADSGYHFVFIEFPPGEYAVEGS